MGVSGRGKWELRVSRVWPGFGRSEKGTGLFESAECTTIWVIPPTYCIPSAVVPFAGLVSDLPIFEIDGDTKSALRFAEPALFGVFALGVNPSNLASLAPCTSIPDHS